MWQIILIVVLVFAIPVASFFLFLVWREWLILSREMKQPTSKCDCDDAISCDKYCVKKKDFNREHGFE